MKLGTRRAGGAHAARAGPARHLRLGDRSARHVLSWSLETSVEASSSTANLNALALASAGRRRSQGGHREHLRLIEMDSADGRVKLNPLANWDQVGSGGGAGHCVVCVGVCTCVRACVRACSDRDSTPVLSFGGTACEWRRTRRYTTMAATGCRGQTGPGPGRQCQRLVGVICCATRDHREAACRD